jgi:protein involved in polysaccharide export with SLBB domain
MTMRRELYTLALGLAILLLLGGAALAQTSSTSSTPTTPATLTPGTLVAPVIPPGILPTSLPVPPTPGGTGVAPVAPPSNAPLPPLPPAPTPLPPPALSPPSPLPSPVLSPPDYFNEPLPLFGVGLFRGATTEALPVQLGPVPPTYVLGSGDVIRVQLATGGVQQVNVDLTADTDGAIYLDNLGRLPVTGMTLAALRALLMQKYSALFHDMSLNVTVPQMRTVDVFVIGEVARPGKYTLPGNATIFTALFAAGGPTGNGSLRAIRLSHADQTVLTVDLYDYLLHGNRVADVPLAPGDSLFLPLAGPLVAVDGLVHRPAQYELLTGQAVTVPEVLAMAGGLLPQAFAGRVQIRRYAANQTFQTVDLNLAAP